MFVCDPGAGGSGCRDGKHWGFGMCLEHFFVAQDYRLGGRTYGCRHYVPTKPKEGKRRRVPAEHVASSNGHRRLRLRAAGADA